MQCSKCGSTTNNFPSKGRHCNACVSLRVQEHKKRKFQKTDDYIRKYKDVPCVDCGCRYPYYVMDFDHLGDKEFVISRYKTLSKTFTEVKKEIAKCDVVCSNCHRIRTFTRALL